MKKCCLLLLCLILLWAFAACRGVEPTVVVDDGSLPLITPTSVPGEPEEVPGNQINGALTWYLL